MIVEDFTMLGTTVPEPNSDGRVFVCSAGWSTELRQLIRIYPLARFGAPRRWSTSKVRLERNPRDSRAESWRLAADRSIAGHPNINESFDVVSSMQNSRRRRELRHAVVDSIGAANERRLSLAIVHPKHAPELFFEHNPDSPDSPELRLFDLDDAPAPEFGARRFAYIPRLRFVDESGEHKLMLRDWGTFEFMRRHGDHRRHELANALHLSDAVSLLVGNLANQRNAWIIISVLSGIRQDDELTLFEEVA